MRRDRERWYIAIDKGQPLPGLFIASEEISDSNSLNIGSFSRKEYAEAVLTTIGDVWQVPVCGFSGGSRISPCLRHHIKKCLAPCNNQVNISDYQAAIEHVSNFLCGTDNESVFCDIEEQIQAAAQTLDFERAARLRDQYGKLRDIAKHISHIPPKLNGKEYLVLLKSRHEECFIWVYIQNMYTRSWVRVDSVQEWEKSSEKIVEYITTGNIPEPSLSGSFRIHENEEGFRFTEAILEVDAVRYFLDITHRPSDIREQMDYLASRVVQTILYPL